MKIVHFTIGQLSFVYYLLAHLYVRMRFHRLVHHTDVQRVCKWGVACLHATSTAVLWIGRVNEFDLLLHSAGYFVADMMGDFSWIYLPHHLVLPLCMEWYLQEEREDIWQPLALGVGLIETGNALTYMAALWPTFTRASEQEEARLRNCIRCVRIVAFSVTRAIAFYVGWTVWKDYFSREMEVPFVVGILTIALTTLFWLYKLSLCRETGPISDF